MDTCYSRLITLPPSCILDLSHNGKVTERCLDFLKRYSLSLESSTFFTQVVIMKDDAMVRTVPSASKLVQQYVEYTKRTQLKVPSPHVMVQYCAHMVRTKEEQKHFFPTHLVLPESVRDETCLIWTPQGLDTIHQHANLPSGTCVFGIEQTV